MKSLILKDIYNLSRNAKSMALVLAFLAVCQIPSIGGAGFLASCIIICTMMVVTSFSFDEHYNWNRYALIMPISRKELVASKFLVLPVVAGTGVAVGLVGALVGTAVTGGAWVAELLALLAAALLNFCLALIIGGTVIPLIFRFGAEKGRLLLILAAVVPTGIGLGIWKLLELLDLKLPEEGLLIAAPVVAAFWCYGAYRISCAIFEKQEL